MDRGWWGGGVRGMTRVPKGRHAVMRDDQRESRKGANIKKEDR